VAQRGGREPEPLGVIGGSDRPLPPYGGYPAPRSAAKSRSFKQPRASVQRSYCVIDTGCLWGLYKGVPPGSTYVEQRTYVEP
jgi:hypothetical protein